MIEIRHRKFRCPHLPKHGLPHTLIDVAFEYHDPQTRTVAHKLAAALVKTHLPSRAYMMDRGEEIVATLYDTANDSAADTVALFLEKLNELIGVQP